MDENAGSTPVCVTNYLIVKKQQTMKIYEIVPKGSHTVFHAVKQGKYFRGWSKTKQEVYDALWLPEEVEVLPAIVEEFLPVGTEVYTSHGNNGEIIQSQYRDENGTLHPAVVYIRKHDVGFVPIWENQLVKAVR